MVLRGQLSGESADEKYVFNDGTGSIQVAIDKDMVQGQTVVGKTVEIEGTVDENLFSEPTVEAERVTVLQDPSPYSESASSVNW